MNAIQTLSLSYTQILSLTLKKVIVNNTITLSIESPKKLPKYKTPFLLASGYGSVDRALTSYTSDLQFESSHHQNFIHLFTINCIEKTKKEKEAGNGPFSKKHHYNSH